MNVDMNKVRDFMVDKLDRVDAKYHHALILSLSNMVIAEKLKRDYHMTGEDFHVFQGMVEKNIEFICASVNEDLKKFTEDLRLLIENSDEMMKAAITKM